MLRFNNLCLKLMLLMYIKNHDKITIVIEVLVSTGAVAREITNYLDCEGCSVSPSDVFSKFTVHVWSAVPVTHIPDKWMAVR